MCTVSFIPINNNTVVITHNRDENKLRSPSVTPQPYKSESGYLFYPVDGKAGGTWFILNETGDAGMLLNGAYNKHILKSSYRLSRGAILPAIFNSSNPIKALMEFDSSGIENFTLILYIKKKLFECKWDGCQLAICHFDPAKPHIWSSVTLYDESMTAQRQHWFNQFLLCSASLSQEKIIDFHLTTRKGNQVYGLQISRPTGIATLNVMSVLLTGAKAEVYYRDCVQQVDYNYSFLIQSAFALPSTKMV